MAQESNPFYIEPLGGFGGDIAKNIGGIADLHMKKRQMQTQQEMKQNAANVLATGDPEKISAFSIKNPEFTKQLWSEYDRSAKISAEETKTGMQSILTNPENTPTILRERAENILSAGGDASDTFQDAMEYQDNPDAYIKGIEAQYALMDPSGYTAYRKATEQKDNKYAQGTGVMSGYVFNESEGSYTVDPEIKQRLMVDAQKKAAKGSQLVGKDLAGVNDKVTGLTKGVMGIHNAATSLSKLKDSSSPASQMAAVFKFMKALDPTSTVRESEQGMVYQAQGPGDRLAGLMNQIVGEGGMTPRGFRDVVNTAAVMANSAIGSSEREVFDYLDVISEYINPKALAKMQARIPGRIETKDSGKMLTDEELLLKYGG